MAARAKRSLMLVVLSFSSSSALPLMALLSAKAPSNNAADKVKTCRKLKLNMP